MTRLTTTRIAALAFALAANAVAQTITIDAAANRAPINPQIYGVQTLAQAPLAPGSGLVTEALLRGLNAPLNRLGGNEQSRYNWRANATNHAQDFYWESISAVESATAGDAADSFIRATKNASAEPMMTIPMVGWVAKLGPDRAKLASFSIQKYGPQKDSDMLYFPDAGNGVRVTGELIVGNDPNDANTPADVSYQQAWVQHFVSVWGASSSGGVRYYAMDNEPSLWHDTHRDVHPNGQTLEELRDKIIAYAQMVKSVDPNALVVAPEEWGWLGYRYSGADQQAGAKNGWSTFPDRMAHGDLDQLPWLLGELARAEARAGKRLVDVCTVHIYPQSGEFSNDVSPAMQLLRNRGTRSLWDRNYVDQSYIATPVYLIPRMHEWVSQNYAGTKIGITEYNWGAENHINGATTQADILGIFGRERLDMATRYATPAATTPTYKAMQMYRNYDGNSSSFGDVSVLTVAPDPDTLSAFAATRTSDGALTIMLVNKQAAPASPSISLSNFRARGVAELWQLTSANHIQRINDLAVAGSRVDMTLPAQSVSLLVLKPATTRRRAARR